MVSGFVEIARVVEGVPSSVVIDANEAAAAARAGERLTPHVVGSEKTCLIGLLISLMPESVSAKEPRYAASAMRTSEV